MERANKFTCPHCGAPLKSVRGVRIGRHIKCVKCGTGFTVRAEDAERAEQAAGVNVARLGIVLAGVLLYLMGGAVLAVFCFVENRPLPQPTTPLASNLEDDNEDVGGGDWSEPKPGQPTISAADQRAIDDAIAKGVWYLKDSQQDTGSWSNDQPVGYAALAGLTLLECGIPANDPAITKAAAFVREQVLKLQNNYDNYQRALTILFLDRLGQSQDESLIQYIAVCLIAGQHPMEGAWSYSNPVLDQKLVGKLLKLLQDKNESLDNWRKTAMKGESYDPGGWDNSNTQFTILALWVAQRHGVAIDKPMTLAEQHFRKSQLHGQSGAVLADPKGDNENLDGSWYYNTIENSGRWPSMTCSGLLGVAVAHAVTTDAAEKKQKPLDDPAIKDALAMLAREIGRDNRPADYYFLWSLERVGVLYNLSAIGGKDWYAWGRKVLLPLQQENGGWSDGGYAGANPTLNTCFVLLFLKQANLAQDLTSKLQLLSEPRP